VSLSLHEPVWRDYELMIQLCCDGAHIFFFFAGVLVLVSSVGLSAYSWRYVLQLYEHVRSETKSKMLLFITRRVIVVLAQVRQRAINFAELHFAQECKSAGVHVCYLACCERVLDVDITIANGLHRNGLAWDKLSRFQFLHLAFGARVRGSVAVAVLDSE